MPGDGPPLAVVLLAPQLKSLEEAVGRCIPWRAAPQCSHVPQVAWASPERNAGQPISSCLCFISCLLGRPEPGSPGQPACPQGAKAGQSPGDNDGKGVLSRAARLLPRLWLPDTPHSSHPTGKTPVQGRGWNFSTRTFGGSGGGWEREGSRGEAESPGSSFVCPAGRPDPVRPSRVSPALP